MSYSLSRFCETFRYDFKRVKDAMINDGLYTEAGKPSKKLLQDKRINIHCTSVDDVYAVFPEEYLMNFVKKHNIKSIPGNAVPLRTTVADPYKPLDDCSYDFKGSHLAVIVACFSSSKHDAAPYEIGVVNEKGQPLLHLILDPEQKLADYVTFRTGVTDDLLKGKPTFADCAEELRSVLNGRLPVFQSGTVMPSRIEQAFRKVNVDFKFKKLISVMDLYKSAGLLDGIEKPTVHHIAKVYNLDMPEGYGALQTADSVLRLLVGYLNMRDAGKLGTTAEE